MQSMFVGGVHTIQDEAQIFEEGCLQSVPPQHARRALETATSLVQRDVEVAAAPKKDRHREADMQMKGLAETLASPIAAPLPSPPGLHASGPPKLLGANHRQSLACQTAVRREKVLFDDTFSITTSQVHNACAIF